jgi:hypothetical protein
MYSLIQNCNVVFIDRPLGIGRRGRRQYDHLIVLLILGTRSGRVIVGTMVWRRRGRSKSTSLIWRRTRRNVASSRNLSTRHYPIEGGGIVRQVA